MFARKSRPPRTIADAMISNKRLVFTCKACRAIKSKEANELFFISEVELTALEQICVCPECGARNVVGKPKQLILTIEE